MSIINEPTACKCGGILSLESTTYQGDWVEKEYSCPLCSNKFTVNFDLVCDEMGLVKKDRVPEYEHTCAKMPESVKIKEHPTFGFCMTDLDGRITTLGFSNCPYCGIKL